jgi:hypothetical protein
MKQFFEAAEGQGVDLGMDLSAIEDQALLQEVVELRTFAVST